MGGGLPLDLKVVEFDGIVVEDLLPLLLREVGDQLLQQVHHLQSHQISDAKLSSTKISLKTKNQQQLSQWTYLEVSQVWDSLDWEPLSVLETYFFFFQSCLCSAENTCLSKPAYAQLLPLCRQASRSQRCTWNQLKKTCSSIHNPHVPLSSLGKLYIYAWVRLSLSFIL